MTLEELGKKIQSRRMEAGLSIEEVANRIKVASRLLTAIEAGKLEALPHAVYAKGFVRSFCQAVGYNKQEMLEDLEAVFPQEELEDTKPEAGPIGRSIPPGRSGGKTVALLLVLIILAGIGSGGWYVYTHYGDKLWELVKTPFSALSSPAPQEEAPAPAASVDIPVQDPVEEVLRRAASSGTPQQEAPAVAPAPSAQENSTASQVSQMSAPEQAASPAAEAEAAPAPAETPYVLLKATEKCWVTYKTDDATDMPHFTMEPGSERIFPYTKKLRITLGNAGGVTVVHNGKEMGAAGKSGKTVHLSFP